MKQNYKIKVDLERVIGRINPNIYGHFIEHMGRCIYGGVYEEGSPLSDKNGFRKDTLEAMQNIKCPVLRWPGGNFASDYHWEDGIGPKDKRPVRFDLAWEVEETNRFGTDEFIAYCRAVGAEPYICVNIGTGNLDEAIHWLEYCNSSSNTYYAKLRGKYGHPEPYNVKYWGVGNENFGPWQVGHRKAKEYAEVLREYAQFMKKVDPAIKIIGVGADDTPDRDIEVIKWDMEVIKTAGQHIDYISNHQYLGSTDYYETVASVYWLEESLKMLSKVIDITQTAVKEKIKIAVDEWNFMDQTALPISATLCDKNNVLKDGLFIAGAFIVLHRLSNVVTMANLSMPVNILGAIHTEKHGLYLTTTYRVFELFVKHSGTIALDTFVQSERYDIEGKILFNKTCKVHNVPYLDASATLTEKEDTLYIAVINYHKEKEIDCPVVLNGFSSSNEAKIYEFNGPDVMAANNFENPEKVKIKTGMIKNAGYRFTYTFPSHSCTIIELHAR